MKALCICQPYEIEYREIPDPRNPTNEEVLLQVCLVGICGSDINTFKGDNPLAQLPRIPGHEIAARVIEKGSNVPTNITIGQMVTVHPYTSCGQCVACRKGRPNTCVDNKTMGVQRDGAMREYLIVDWRNLYFNPENHLTYQQLALVEPLSVGYHAIDRGQVKSGDIVVIIGCGAVGMGAIAGAIARNATVIVTGRTPAKLDVTKQLGAHFTIDASKSQLDKELNLIAPNGPDVIIEASGGIDMFSTAVRLVSVAGKIVCVGYCPNPIEFITIPIVKKELTILGSRNALASDFQGVIGQIVLGHLPVDALSCKTFSWSNALSGFCFADGNNPVSKRLVQVSV